MNWTHGSSALQLGEQMNMSVPVKVLSANTTSNVRFEINVGKNNYGTSP
jgi:hypothetical protein